MKILSIITSGGKYLAVYGIFLSFSCDYTQRLTVNGKQMVSYSLHDNEVRIAAGNFGLDYWIFISSDKAITVQPDSFQYEFSQDVSCEKIDYSAFETKKSKLYRFILRGCWLKSLTKDSSMLKIIPNDYIQYKGKRVIDDTLYINLNANEYKKLKNMR